MTAPEIELKLTEWTECGGCAAKWGGVPLSGFLSGISGGGDERLMLGLAPFDDAAVYRLAPDLALVSTTDFFPPLVDDPDDYGTIAAANACSDVLAMGGRVVMALNIAAFPEELPAAAIQVVLAAAARTVAEAGGSVAGGHTIRSKEPVFGLAVQGLVHPDRVWRKSGARPGDRLLLSKPLGTGLVLAGGSEADRAAAIAGMRGLNLASAASLSEIWPSAVTDVTGYGLAGHSWEMAERSGATIVLRTSDLPAYPGARTAAAAGVRTGGHDRNRAYVGAHLRGDPADEALVCDPQTSGGLLAAVSGASAERLLASGAGWHEIGFVREGEPAVELV
ncbi:MAG: selenide, water dikinase SelD [Acidimicrobiales bacterium]|nr:selenide, water dikinase SelD [Acidimicrobiales bacterium]